MVYVLVCQLLGFLIVLKFVHYMYYKQISEYFNKDSVNKDCYLLYEKW